jgi:glycine betaine/proline transport system permease protein
MSVASLPPAFLPRRWAPFLALAVALAAAALLWLLDGHANWAVDYPTAWVIDVTDDITLWTKWLARDFDLGIVRFSELTRGLAWAVEQPLYFLRGVLADGIRLYLGGESRTQIPPLPWVFVAGAFTLLGWWAGRTPLAMLAALSFVYFALFGLWEQAMMTLASVAVAVAAATAVGLGLGVVGYRSRRAEAVLTPVYDVMQTLPVFSYLVPVILFFGFGPVAALIATIIYAMPPMARVTTLALRRVPQNVKDFADVSGCTPVQKHWQVLVPSARHGLMIGVNQVIMLSLAMVIIASIIGAGGLGADVLRALQSLRIGDAVEAGVAITLMAIVLDRLSQAAAAKRPLHEEGPRRPFWSWPILQAGFALLLTSLVLARVIPALQDWPQEWTITTGAFWNGVITWINTNLHAEIGAFRDWMFINVMRPTRDVFLAAPWLGVVVLTASTAWVLVGVRLALASALMLIAIAVSGYWPQAMLSLYLVMVSVFLAVLIGLPIGLAAALFDRFNRAVTVVIDTIQTLPTFVYLIPVVMLFSIGEFPALVAIVLYALPPVIRYTKEGIRAVPQTIIEAADLSGCTRAQKLIQVQIPLALPDIMLGINQTVMMAFGMLVITALVGTRGLEQETLIAISKVRPGEGIVAGLGIAFLSIILDRLIGGASHRLRRRLGLSRSPGVC